MRSATDVEMKKKDMKIFVVGDIREGGGGRGPMAENRGGGGGGGGRAGASVNKSKYPKQILKYEML